MTIRYTSSVATNSYFSFLRLLLRWRGSVLQYIWFELALFIGLYVLISITYDYVMFDSWKSEFEHFCLYCRNFQDTIPVFFVLGFFVNALVERWWGQFMLLPWPDELAMYLNAYTVRNTERTRMQRRTIVRYVNLAFAMVARGISSRARLRFPSEANFISAGLMTNEEYAIFQEVNEHYSVPVAWACEIVKEMRREGSIDSDRTVEILFKILYTIRGKLGDVLAYDMIVVPLVYVQVATVAVYTFTLSSLFGLQFEVLDEDSGFETSKKIIFPILGLLRFIFYMGWLKVAECLINPFGEDPDDYEMEEIVERNIHISFDIVDGLFDQVPPLSRGVLLEVVEVPEASRKGSTTGLSHHVSVAGSELFLGSMVNLNASTRHRRLTSMFSSKQAVDSNADQ